MMTTTTTDYTHLKDWDVQKDFIDKLTDAEKTQLFCDICDDFGNPDELEEIEESKWVSWVTNDLIDWLPHNEDITFVCTITFKDDVPDELLETLVEEGCFELIAEEKQIKFHPEFDAVRFPEEANLVDFWHQCSWKFDFSQVEYFQVGDG